MAKELKPWEVVVPEAKAAPAAQPKPWEIKIPEVTKAEPQAKRLYSYKDLENALVKQESGGDYNAIGKPYLKKKTGKMASMERGELAIGKYQIVPETWFKTIGLDPLNKADRRKFWKSPELQDQAFRNVIAENRKLYPNSVDKQIVAYYGGPRAAAGLGTEAADEEYNGKSWNQYLADVKRHMRAAGPTGRFIGDNQDSTEVDTNPPEAIAKSQEKPIEKPAVTNDAQPWGVVANQFGAFLPPIKQVVPKRDAEELKAQREKSERNKELGQAYLDEAADNPGMTPAGYANKMQPGGDKRWGITKGIDWALDAAAKPGRYLGAALEGKGITEAEGEKVAREKQDLERVAKWETGKGKELVDRAKQKFSDGHPLSGEEQYALSENPGFVQGMKDFGKAFVNSPDETLRTMAKQILEDGPVMVITTGGVGAAINAMRAAGYAYKGQKVARYAKKLMDSEKALEKRNIARVAGELAETAKPTQKLVDRAARLGKARSTEDLTAHSMAKKGFTERFVEDQVENIAGAAVTGYAKEEAEGGDYTGKDFAQEVVTGSVMGGLTSGAGAKFDTRVSKGVVDKARDVAHLSSFQKHPEIQSMLPMFDAIARNKEANTIRFKGGEVGGSEWTREMLDKANYPNLEPGKYDIAGKLDQHRATIGTTGNKAAVAEETTHYLQKKLREKAAKEPEFAEVLQDIKDWEAGIKESATQWNKANPDKPKITLPSGDELFGQTFTKYMGYGQHFDEQGSIVSRLVLPDEVVKGFKKLMTDDTKLKGDGFEHGDLAASSELAPRYAEAKARKEAADAETTTAKKASEIEALLKEEAKNQKLKEAKEQSEFKSRLKQVQKEDAAKRKTHMPLAIDEFSKMQNEANPLPETVKPQPVQVIETSELRSRAERSARIKEQAKADADRELASREIPDELYQPAKARKEAADAAAAARLAKKKEQQGIPFTSTRAAEIKAHLIRNKLPAKDTDVLAWNKANRNIEVPQREFKPEAPKTQKKKQEADYLKSHTGQKVVDALTVMGSNNKPTGLIRIHPDDVAKVTGRSAGAAANLTSTDISRELGRRVVVSKSAPTLQSIADGLNESRYAEGATLKLDKTEASGPNGEFTHDDLAEALRNHPGTRAAVKKEAAAADKKIKDLELGYDPNKYDPNTPVKKEFDPKKDGDKSWEQLQEEGITPFQLKKSVQTEQKDLFGNKGRVASQGLIRATKGDKGLEDTPLFKAADAEATKTAQKEQQSLFQLKKTKDQEPKKTLFAGLSDGNPPLVEKRVKEFRRAEASINKLPATLLRDHRIKWGDSAEEVERMATQDLSHFLNIVDRRPLDPVEMFALGAKTEAMKIQNEEILSELKKVKDAKFIGDPTPEAIKAFKKAKDDKVKALTAEHSLGVSDLLLAVEAELNTRTRTGRSLAAARVIMNAADMNSDVSIIRKILKEIPNLTKDAQNKLVYLYRHKPEDFAAALQKAKGSTVLDKVLETRNAGLLTGLGTHIKNLGSNTLERATLTLETAMASGADKALQKIYGGDRTRYLSDAKAELAAIQESTLPALKEFGKDVKDTFQGKDKPIDLSARFDYQVGAVPGKFGKAVRVPFRLLEASDKMFKSVGFQASVRKQANRQAIREGLKGNKIDKRVNEIIDEIKNEPEKHTKLLQQAYKDADIGVFQNDVDGFTKWILEGTRRFKVLRVFAPFIKTPSNILRRTIDRSPLAFMPFHSKSATTAFTNYRNAIKTGESKAKIAELQGIAADKISRAFLGTGAMATFIGMGASGLITGGGPKDKQKMYALKKTGWQPYSVHIPGVEYVSYAGFEPWASLIGASADIAEGFKHPDEIGAVSVLDAVNNNLVNKSYMTGLADFIEFAGDIGKGQKGAAAATKYLSQTASTFVPFSAILNKSAKAIDNTVRDTKPENKGLVAFPEEMVKTTMAKLPFASKRLPAMQEGGGEIATHGTGPIQRFLGVGTITKENANNDVYKTLVDLDYLHSKPPKEVYPKGKLFGKIRINEEEREVFQKYNRMSTQEIARISKRSDWSRKDPQEQKDIITDIYRDNQKLALGEVNSKVRRRLRD